MCHVHEFKNFPQFDVIHTVKGFGRVNKAEVDVFPELSCFFHDPMDVGNLISGSSVFSSLNIWKFTYCWSLAWRSLIISLLVCDMSAIVWYFEHSLALPFFGIGMKTDFFQSCGYCWVFQFACILSVALSQHHPWGFEIAQLEFYHLQSPLNFSFQDVWL